MAASAIITLLAALFKAIPAERELVGVALEASQSANVADAVKRWREKNKAVKAALEAARKGGTNV